jgi:5-formyltetrahydrofolate cyclo-ligase
MNKVQLRRDMRQRRRALSSAERRKASVRLAKAFESDSHLLASRRIALYLVNDGEIDPAVLVGRLVSRSVQVYLPSLHPIKRGHLAFIRYQPGKTPMVKNRYGISEPDFRRGHRISPRFLSHVLMPLVAFDQCGNRLGMGGGYYDRTFAFINKRPARPKLVGCAYECQSVEYISHEEWDIPLPVILTEVGLRQFN